jgi:hypothetical protein
VEYPLDPFEAGVDPALAFGLLLSRLCSLFPLHLHHFPGGLV